MRDRRIRFLGCIATQGAYGCKGVVMASMATVFASGLGPMADAREEERCMKKIAPATMSVEDAVAGFEQRHRQLLEWSAAFGKDPHGRDAATRLLLGRDLKAANLSILELAEWFERPPTHPAGHQGNCDFAALGLSRVREGRACAGLRMLGGHKWTTTGEWRGVEVISPGAKNAAVCEAGLLADFGGFEAFRREVAGNEIRFDRNAMRLTYASKRAGTIAMDTKQLRTVNGKPVDMDYPSFDSPFVQADWDSEVITIKCGGKSMRLDFRERNESS
jgi:hypothetical protein